MKFQALASLLFHFLVVSAVSVSIDNNDKSNPTHMLSPVSRALYNKRLLTEEQSFFCNFTLTLMRAFVPDGLMDCSCSHVGDMLNPSSTTLSCETCEFCKVNTNQCAVVGITNTQDNIAMRKTDVICTKFSSPLSGEECTTTVTNTATDELESCSVMFNNQQCKSCKIVNCTSTVIGVVEQDVEYDCTNLGWIQSNNCDDSDSSGDLGALGAVCKTSGAKRSGAFVAVLFAGVFGGLLLLVV